MFDFNQPKNSNNFMKISENQSSEASAKNASVAGQYQ